jgi:hypothetical protein
MTQQFLNPASTAPNDKLGDTPHSASDKINTNFTENYTSIATNEAAILANTALITGFTETYWFDANDTATATTPISHTGGATNTYLTNDAVGGNTTSYNPNSKDTLWKPATNKFDFTSLKIGDVVNFRLDIEFDNAAAQEVDLIISLAEGTAPYEKHMSHLYYKTAATGTPITAPFEIYIGDAETRDGGCRFRFSSADAASIKVNGWYYRITEV